ncbi:MAG TPA: energy-coupling factor transporter transmembrane protein EcfT [Candidatus Rubneribacter avistercoris]|nr:energy-coupling factor transporter transmembrane protein EcfT [Candidatus Rubneribacter avistercoris]
MREGAFGLDPRTHVVAIVAFGMASIVLTGVLETVLLQVAAALYLTGNGRARLALRSCVSFAAACGLSFLPLPGLYGVLFVSLMHMVPPFTAGCALFSLSPSAIMCALARWRVPRRVLVGVCMLFRFASVLPFEARSIVRGIRMRGIFPHVVDVVRHPALVYECCYTPLVMRCLRLSAELAASAELRGIEADGARTSVHHVGFGARDVLAAATVLAVCAGLCVWGKVV